MLTGKDEAEEFASTFVLFSVGAILMYLVPSYAPNQRETEQSSHWGWGKAFVAATATTTTTTKFLSMDERKSVNNSTKGQGDKTHSTLIVI